VLFATPVLAQEEGPYPPRVVKGMFELDFFTQIVSRRVVEEVSPGVDFKGDAVSTRVMAKFRVKPVKPLELYLQGGAANLKINDFNGYRGDYSFAYGGGINLTLYEDPVADKFRLIMSGDALTFTTDDSVLTTIQSNDVLVKEEIQWVEYAAGATGTWRVRNWDPYIGVRFSWLNSTDDIEDPSVGKLTLQEDRNIGVVAGTDVYLDKMDKIALNLEASLIDQASFKIGLKLWY
jgi:hypothetical protein